MDLSNFNWKIYLELNPDLDQNCNEEEAIYHYNNYGKIENRKINIESPPNDFNWYTYLRLNPDLNQNCNEIEAVNHYIRFGFLEKRRYKMELSEHDNSEIFHKYFNSQITNDIINHKEIINHRVINYKDCNKYSFFHQDKINYTVNKKIEPKISNIDNIKSLIVVIDFPNLGGGTGFFINSIVSKYKFFQTFLIVRNYNEKIEFSINDVYVLDKSYTYDEAITFLQNHKNKINKIFFNHIKGHSHSFLNQLFELNKETTLLTHDYSILMDNPQPFYHEIHDDTLEKNKININQFHRIITQNKSNLSIFNTFLTKETDIIISPLPDFKNSLESIKTNNKSIVIGIIGMMHEFKGREIVISLHNYIKKHKLNINLIIFGEISDKSIYQEYYADINVFNKLLKKYKPNLLLEANLWPETWSYTLTLAMLTQLPILTLKKPFVNVIEDRLSEYTKTYYYHTISDIVSLSTKVKQNFLYTIDPVLYYNSFWDNYFISKKEKITDVSHITTFQNDIKPYFIYFPQFHHFHENNISFYPDFTDITNLDLLEKSKIYTEVQKPSFQEFSLTKIDDYNYFTRKDIIQKQIDMITHYGFPGFAVYFYWFSLNTITNENMIMESVINTFFDNTIHMNNRKIFFIWANESWTKNSAFGINDCKIENEYTEENITKVTVLFVYYFLKDTYLKIDNKPVLLLLHPWFLTNNELDLFFTILNQKCIEKGFAGVHFIVNSMAGNYDHYLNYSHHFNYKKGKSTNFDENKKQLFLDYKNYIEIDIDDEKKNIQSIVFDFDNRARLFKPDKLHLSTICTNNTEVDKIRFMEKIIHKYVKNKGSDVENILLLNAWNEWGEKMTFEPSEELGYYNLNLLNDYLRP